MASTNCGRWMRTTCISKMNPKHEMQSINIQPCYFIFPQCHRICGWVLAQRNFLNWDSFLGTFKKKTFYGLLNLLCHLGNKSRSNYKKLVLRRAAKEKTSLLLKPSMIIYERSNTNFFHYKKPKSLIKSFTNSISTFFKCGTLWYMDLSPRIP